MAIRERIAKVLQIARDQKGTPQGETAAAIAQHLMEKHGILLDAEDLPEAPPVPMIKAVVATYTQIEPWRQHLVMLVQLLWDLSGSWGYDDELITLYFTIEESREATLVRAVNYYLDLEIAIMRATKQAAPSMIGSDYRLGGVDPFSPKAQELFRRGVTDAWCAAIDRLLSRYKEKMAEQIMDADLTVIGTALARIPVTLNEDEGSAMAPLPHEAEDADMVGMMIYEMGLMYGSRVYDWPVPDLDEADGVPDSRVDEAPGDEAH